MTKQISENRNLFYTKANAQMTKNIFFEKLFYRATLNVKNRLPLFAINNPDLLLFSVKFQ